MHCCNAVLVYSGTLASESQQADKLKACKTDIDCLVQAIYHHFHGKWDCCNIPGYDSFGDAADALGWPEISQNIHKHRLQASTHTRIEVWLYVCIVFIEQLSSCTQTPLANCMTACSAPSLASASCKVYGLMVVHDGKHWLTLLEDQSFLWLLSSAVHLLHIQDVHLAGMIAMC